jgi:putative heme iron utilization protein
MLDERRVGDPLEGARVMLMGTAQSTADPHARRRYLARQAEAKMFADFADFGFYRIALKGAHLVAGFGRIVDLSSADLTTDVAGADTLLAAEDEIVAHMNAEHLAAIRLYATRLLGDSDGDWRCVGCDPGGLEIQWDRRARRLDFPQRVTSPGVLRQVLKSLAEEARQKG